MLLQDVIEVMGEVPANPHNAIPKKKVKLVDCGMNEIQGKYDLPEDWLDSQEDLDLSGKPKKAAAPKKTTK